MKRFSWIELCGLALGAIFFFAGLALVIWPQPGVITRFTNDALGFSPHHEMEVVTRTGARVYGVVAMLLGTVIAALAVYRQKS